MITRRNFMKAVFVSAGILALPSVRLLEAALPESLKNIPWFPCTGITNNTIGLFMSELASYPEGSAAHSIANVEIWPNAIIGDDLGFYPMIRGLSYGKVPGRAKYWAFEFDEEEFIQDMAFRRKLIDNSVSEIASAWKRDGAAHWDTPWKVAWGPSVPEVKWRASA